LRDEIPILRNYMREIEGANGTNTTIPLIRDKQKFDSSVFEIASADCK